MKIHHHVACNACGKDVPKQLTTTFQYSIVTCTNCGLIYVNPMPHFVKETFSNVSESFPYTVQQQLISNAKLSHAQSTAAIQIPEWGSFLPTSSKRALLDIGCGPGLLVHAVKENGWYATGCDLDKKLIQLGNERLSLNMTHGDFHSCEYSENQFDVVMLRYVLEHLPDPFATLTEAHRVLKPGGIVQVIVPNEAGFFNKISVAIGRKRTGRWGTLTPPHHLHAFTPHTLKRIFARAGLKTQTVKTVSPYTKPYDLFLDDHRRAFSLSSLLFKTAECFGRGSALVAYAQKPYMPENIQANAA